MSRDSRRCIVLFARSARAEGRAKRIVGGERLFVHLERKLRRAARLIDVPLIAVGCDDAAVIRQRGDSFGERLVNAVADVRALGFGEIVIVPVDAPGLGARELAAAFSALGAHDHVLGPSPDGGVYLIGTRAKDDALFEGVRWGSSSVAHDLLACGGAIALLRTIRDVDSSNDLEQLRCEQLDPSTRALVASLVRLLPDATAFATRAIVVAPALSGRAPPAVPL